MKSIVIYFSAGGNTERVAKELAGYSKSDIFKIEPVTPYSGADLKWTNPLARCNREKFGKKDVPVSGKIENFEEYDEVSIGFPIWYGAAPNVVNAFCTGYDWNGKNVKHFATSAGSGIGKTAEKLEPYVKGAKIVSAEVVRG